MPSRIRKHVVLPEHYLARNPYLPVPTAINNIAAGPVPIFRISPVEHWRHIWSNSGQERLSRDVVRRSSDRAQPKRGRRRGS